MVSCSDFRTQRVFNLNKHTVKILSNGYEVPYPGKLVYGDCLFLKEDYRLNQMPINFSDEIEGDYIQWLQDYLYSCDIILTLIVNNVCNEGIHFFRNECNHENIT